MLIKFGIQSHTETKNTSMVHAFGLNSERSSILFDYSPDDGQTKTDAVMVHRCCPLKLAKTVK